MRIQGGAIPVFNGPWAAVRLNEGALVMREAGTHYVEAVIPTHQSTSGGPFGLEVRLNWGHYFTADAGLMRLVRLMTLKVGRSREANIGVVRTGRQVSNVTYRAIV